MENTHEEEIEIDLREIFFALKKKILLIVAAALLTGCLSCVYTQFFMTPVYTSTSSMLVLTKETTLSSLADLQMGSQLTNDYKVLITSRPVLEDTIKNLDLDMTYKELKQAVTINNPQDTRILEITVNNPDAEMAKTIVNELASVSSAFIGDKMEVVPPKIIESGEIPTEKTSPSMKKNALLGLLAGFVLCAGIIVLMSVLDDSIKTEDDIEKYLGLSTLSSVPDRKDYISGKKRGSKKKKRNRKGRK